MMGRFDSLYYPYCRGLTAGLGRVEPAGRKISRNRDRALEALFQTSKNSIALFYLLACRAIHP